MPRSAPPWSQGFILASVLAFMVVLMALLAAYFTLTRIEGGSSGASARQTTGFYAAEAGLNLRGEAVRARFVGFARPSGVSPSGPNPCQGTNLGSGDFACQIYTLSGRKVITYVIEQPGNPRPVQIPPGELFAGLNAQEYRYSVLSRALSPQGDTEAILEMVFKSRLVPLFQFLAFYNKDLEILPGVDTILNGRLHANGDLYLSTVASIQVTGQVSASGTLYRGRKDADTCASGPVSVADPFGAQRLLPCGSSRQAYTPTDLLPWGTRIQVGVDPLTLPAPGSLDPNPANSFFSQANLRLALNLGGATPALQVLTPSGTVDALATSSLLACTGSIGGKAAGYSTSFYNNREGKKITMLEVDLQALLDCLHRTLFFGAGKDLNDPTNGGLVLHFTVLGPNSASVNGYGVRLRNGGVLASSDSGAPRPLGVTVVSDQAVYLQGDYNRNASWIPAAVLADTINVLSNNWSSDANSTKALNQRPASATEVNAAFLAATDTTGGQEGPPGQDQGYGTYNGGLENYPRFHEDWAGTPFTYRGSFVSLGRPRHAAGAWCLGGGCPTYGTYSAPKRIWSYDTRFDQAQLLPPLSPRFTYLRQERFIRQFEQ